MFRSALRSFLLVGALALGGCVTDSVLVGGTSVTAPIANPVTVVDLTRAKTVYTGTLDLVVRYRDYCWARPYAALMADPLAAPVCRNRRAVVRQAQAADIKAFNAIRAAENFVRDNPTVSAVSLIRAALQAVTDFQGSVPAGA